MTEKRFTFKNDYYKGLILVDNLTNEIIEEDIGTGSCYNACNLLNRYDEDCKMYREDALKAEKNKEVLLEENELLKQSLKRQQSSNEECSKYIEGVANENKQLKSFVEYEKRQHKHWKRECLENIKEIAQLKREIVQLKSDVKSLEKENEQLKQEIKKLELEIIRLETIIKTGDDGDYNRTS